MSASSALQQKYALGLDLGSASLGWALIQLNELDEPTNLIRAGVRIFEPGVDGTLADIAEGKDQSRAVERRTARLHRRQLRRRAARQRDLFKLLQRNSLLPTSSALHTSASEERHAILNALDREICLRWSDCGDQVSFTQLPLYLLRKAALQQKLGLFELGRVLYHLSQRRGFLSNRRETAKNPDEEKELGQVKAGITELEAAIKASGSRTLGEYLAGLDPHQSDQHVRRRWTARKMYEGEFDLIWKKQAEFYPDLLTQDLRKLVSRLLYFQRPVADQAHLIGKCELEPGERRAAWATLEAQRFRVLQKVNDCQVVYPGNAVSRPLSGDERAIVRGLLDSEGDQSFAKLRKQLNIDKGATFNLERGGEKKLRGNRTNATMHRVFGERWASFTDEQRKQIVEEWRTSESADWLTKRGADYWGLGPDEAAAWAASNPEPGYCSLSRKAISKLLPQMADGTPFKTAETAIYGDRFSGAPVLHRLPIVRQYLTTLRNPAVERALTEMRKVVNAIVREHGKPHEIRIELARELKKPRQERVSASKANRKRQKEREEVMQRILLECGIPKERQSRRDVEKALLHVECGGMCPYTGKSIPFSNLFQDSQFDVEHIIPRSRYPEDSFQNKTLCYLPANRERKRNKTPFEAYGSNEQEWAEVLERVRRFNNPGKLKRFQLETLDDLESFSARQMNDTRYASILAGRLLGTLYGGRDQQTAGGIRQKVFVSSGAVTATLRRSWGLEAILQGLIGAAAEAKGKPRSDHRHHAIDAIVIALTRQGMIQRMARAASLEPWQDDARAWRKIESPWPNFVESIRPAIAELLVSHRPEHKMSGPLHDETLYGRPQQEKGKTYVHVRKPVSNITAKDMEAIVDPVIRSAVEAKAQTLSGELTKCEANQDWPTLTAANGRSIPIKRVRLRKVLNVTPIGHGPSQRFVAESNNHHVAVFANLDSRDHEKRWDGMVVSLLEAVERDRKNLPVITRCYGDAANLRFKFSLMGGDTIELHRDCDHTSGRCRPEVYRLRTIAANSQLSLVRITDARLKDEIKKAKEWWSPMPDALRKLNAQKVQVDLLGRIRYAND